MIDTREQKIIEKNGVVMKKHVFDSVELIKASRNEGQGMLESDGIIGCKGSRKMLQWMDSFSFGYSLK